VSSHSLKNKTAAAIGALSIVLVMEPHSQADIDLATAMLTLPEFMESRARAENARSEGRTSSAAQFLADFNSRHVSC
jgi:hypothetical protein